MKGFFPKKNSKMKRKSKLIASIGVLSVAIFGMIMGVYALVQRQITIGGTVSFSASTVRATYTVSKTDAYTGDTMGALTQIATGTFNETNQNNATAELGNIMLSDNAERFAYQVEIVSTESVRDLHVSFTVPAPTQNWLTVLVNGEATPETTAVIAAGQTLTVTFVIVADAYNAPESAENIEIGTNFVIGLSEEDSLLEQQARIARQTPRLSPQNTYNPQNIYNQQNTSGTYNQTNQTMPQPEVNY